MRRYATNIVQRVRHYRGHGIHSPFVYSLVREVFMAKKLLNKESNIYNNLIERGVSNKIAVEVANLHDYCSDYQFCIYSQGEELAQIIEHPQTAIVVVASAVGGRLDDNYTSEIERKEYLSISRRGYMLFFYNTRLPIQHFIL